MAEPLIFNNFGSKEALFTEAVTEPFNARFREFLTYSDTLPPDREERSMRFVQALYPFLRDHADLLLAMVKSRGMSIPRPFMGWTIISRVPSPASARNMRRRGWNLTCRPN